MIKKWFNCERFWLKTIKKKKNFQTKQQMNKNKKYLKQNE